MSCNIRYKLGASDHVMKRIALDTGHAQNFEALILQLTFCAQELVICM